MITILINWRVIDTRLNQIVLFSEDIYKGKSPIQVNVIEDKWITNLIKDINGLKISWNDLINNPDFYSVMVQANKEACEKQTKTISPRVSTQ